MQQCPTCGSLNPDNAEVCADCGMELSGHAATPKTPASAPQTPASVPQTPAAAPFDFAPEAAHTPEAHSPAPSPAPLEAAGGDPFAGNSWDFDLDKGMSATPAHEAQKAPEPHGAMEPAIVPDHLDPMGAPPLGGGSAPTTVIEPPVAPASPSPAPATSGTAKLLLKRGGAPTGDVFSIGPNATIGRFDPESGPVDVDMANLPEAVYISRHHADILLRDGQWMVKDLGSRNGTFVKTDAGFDRVTGETPIQSGQEIAFGNARFEFQSG